jgi:hypothetical protein
LGPEPSHALTRIWGRGAHCSSHSSARGSELAMLRHAPPLPIIRLKMHHFCIAVGARWRLLRTPGPHPEGQNPAHSRREGDGSRRLQRRLQSDLDVPPRAAACTLTRAAPADWAWPGAGAPQAYGAGATVSFAPARAWRAPARRRVLRAWLCGWLLPAVRYGAPELGWCWPRGGAHAVCRCAAGGRWLRCTGRALHPARRRRRQGHSGGGLCCVL